MVPIGPQASLAYVIPPILGFLVLLGVALISLIWGGMKRTNILFAGICFLAAILNADVALVSILPDEKLALKVDRAIHLLFVFSIPVYIQFVHAFLEIRRRRWLEILAWLLGLAFFTIVPTDLYISGLRELFFGRIARAGPLFHLFSAAIAFTVLYCLAVLYSALRATRDNLRKNRIKYVLGGVGFSALLMSLTIRPVSGVPMYPMGNFSFIPAVFLAFGVLKYDLLDIGALIRKGTVYFILTGILTLLYILILFILHFLFLGGESGNPLAVSIVLALVVVLLFNPFRERVQGLIDRLFFRRKYDYQALLREVSGKMATLLRVDQIRRLLIDAIGEALQVEGVSLAMAEGRGFRLYGRSGTADEDQAPPAEIAILAGILAGEGRALNRTDIERIALEEGERSAVRGIFDALRAALVVPIPSPNGLSGMIVLGQKKSGELFVDEDRELLSTIANQAATALENARSYEALEALNRNLEKRVAERTSALREALAEKERTQEQLIRSESLAAIGQLVAGTAHELNNPIASAMSLVETSVENIGGWGADAGDREEVVDDLRFSLGELRRAGAIIRSLLDLSRQTQTYMERVEINRAVDDALRVLYNQYKNLPVEIVKEYDETSPAVEGNFANLGQVLINIIRNALQALPEGRGRITLTTKRLPETDTVLVECRDTGSGIPARLLKDVFKPFFTTKTVGRGTGLGLYLSHEIIRRHGGQIRIASEEGRGTEVTVELPCSRREP